MNKFILTFHTIRYLRFVQIRYQLWFRIRGFMRKIGGSRYPLAIQKNGGDLFLDDWICKPLSFESGTFTFLNQSRTFEERGIDWEFSGFGKLWTYNLNYFDFLHQSEKNLDEKLRLIEDFIVKLKNNSVALEPYPIALRGINWIKFLSRYKSEISDIGFLNRMNSSLYAQYQILRNNLEYHLLGNHLLEDGFSLLFGAFYFKEKKLYDKARSIVVAELKEQILADGGHFELSPMYHQILLDRLLDCINLLQNNQEFDNQNDLLRLMIDKGQEMLEWLQQMTHSTGEIPMLNDSAPGIAPSTGEITKYARRLKVRQQNLNIELSSSGYREFKNSLYECYIDVGPAGPSYQPGHAHADTFNFVLNTKNVPFIVDTGISTYNANSTRLYERSTAAHNTVTVSDKSSSQVWSSFRMARRARVKIIKDEKQHVLAQHYGYKSTVHKREWRFLESRIEITDILEGKEVDGKAHFVLAPSVLPDVNGQLVECELAIIAFRNARSIKTIAGHIPDGYNRFLPNYHVEVSFEGRLETIITLNIDS